MAKVMDLYGLMFNIFVLLLNISEINVSKEKSYMFSPTGYVLLVPLQPTKGSPLVLVSNRHDIRLVDAGSTNANNTTILMDNLNFVAHLDILYSENKRVLFWTDAVRRSITATLLAETRTTLWTIKQELVGGITYDWIGGNIYWTNVRDKSVKVANKDGLYKKTLFRENVELPGDIAVDPNKRYMFWLDRGDSGAKIERAGMAGDESSREVIITDDLQHPIALALDYSESKIYFSDNLLRKIERCDYDGSNRRLIRQYDDLSEVMSLSVYGSALYGTIWTSSNNTDERINDYYVRKSVFTCDKTSGTFYRTIVDLDDHPLKLRVMEPDMQSTEDSVSSPCNVSNGGCSSLCLLSPVSPYNKCACPTGIKFLDNNNKSCASGVENALLLTRKYEVSMISLDTTDNYRVDIPISAPGMYQAIGIDYDPVEDYVYILDNLRHMYFYLKRINLNDSDVKIILNRKPVINGFVLDTDNRNIYYTNGRRRRIEVVNTNGKSKRKIVSRNLRNPYAIDIDRENGYLYWTDTRSRKIERSRLDGSQREVIVNTGLRKPVAICVDMTDNKIYWADYQLRKIEVSNKDGSRRRTLVRVGVTYDQGLTISGDYLYVISNRRELVRVNKRTGEDRKKILDADPRLRAIKAAKLH